MVVSRTLDHFGLFNRKSSQNAVRDLILRLFMLLASTNDFDLIRVPDCFLAIPVPRKMGHDPQSAPLFLCAVTTAHDRPHGSPRIHSCSCCTI